MPTRIPHLLAGTLARVAVAALIAAIVLITAAQQLGGSGPWWLELSRYVPYRAVLVPAAAALLLSGWLGRGWVAASAAALALQLSLGMGFEWPRPDRGDTPLRLMTYNIKGPAALQHRDGLERLAREVVRHRPDVLVMQEAHGVKGLDLGAVLHQGAALDFPHVVAAGQYVVASRFPLRDCASGPDGERGADPQYLRCAVEAGGVTVTIVTAHFESPRRGLNAARREGLDGVGEWRQNYEFRLGQATALAHDLVGSPRAVIVAGDLNAPESSPVIRRLLGLGLRDAFSSAGRGYGYSYGQALWIGYAFLRIDHILLSPQIGVTDCFVGSGDASDHRPVIADLWLHRR